MNTKKPEKIIITSEDCGIRLDIFLSSLYSSLSRSALQKQIKTGNILINSKQAKTAQILKTEDVLEINLEEKPSLSIEPEEISIEVLYEDESMAVVKKPKDMLTHPTAVENTNTLVNALLHRFTSLCDCNGPLRPGIVHRLDRNTPGLLMIAKTNEAYEFLKEKMQNREITKKYYAVASGNFENDCGTINSNIGRNPSRPEKMAVVQDGKPSITHYKVLERLNGYTLLDITLATGRTHQIRVHLSSIGHPIVCDSLYGGAKLPVKTIEQVLQAYSLTFVSPFDKKERTITIDFDDDIIKVLNYLRNKK